MEQSLSRFLDDEFGSAYYSPEYQTESASISDETPVKKDYISLEDYANKESPVWRNVAYEDDGTKSAITQDVHKQMVDSGAIVKIADGVMENIEQSYPDLRGMKKKERTPILKQAITTLKNSLRQYLGGISNQSFEFEVNGKILEAKLYNTGINEVLEKVTKEKASMLYSSEKVFRNARYLYSTPDYDGNTKVYRWNYFYTPVQIGDETVGVRIAVRDMVKNQESQIYNWGIKKDTSLDGVGGGTNARRPNGVSSDVSTDTVTQAGGVVNQNSSDRMSMSEEDFLDSMGGSGPEADPFADRSWHEVGKRSEKAFMAQNPEVKPLFQDEAAMMYSELVDTTRGERTFNEDAYYQSGGEAGWSGTKRHTSGSLEELLDSGFTYDQIEKGLMSIMKDHGAENNAAAKRIEFIINDRLLNGYTNFYDGRRVPPSADYAAFVNGQSAQGTDTPNMSVEGGRRFEATGAADQNFTGKAAYADLLSDENAQPDRATDARPMEVPKRDADGKRVTEFGANAYGAPVTPDSMANAIESLIQDGELSFDTRTNKESLENARKVIKKDGEEETIRRISDNARAGRIQDGDIEQGLVLYAKYANDPKRIGC